MRQRFSIATLGALIVALSLQAADSSWPQWRGPKRDGLSSDTGLLKSWEKTKPKLLWQTKGAGNGYSSVVIDKGIIYTLGQKKRQEHLTAFREKDGELLWSVPFGSGRSNGTPTVNDGRVYAIGQKGDFICADAKTGEKLWTKNFEKDFDGKMMSGWGFSESPLVDGDWVLCTPGADDAMILAMDKKTGKVIWKAATPDLGRRGRDGAGYSSIVISNGAGVKQYVQLTGRGMIGIRAKDGKSLWTYNRVANGTANIPTPIVSGDYVFCSTGYGAGAALLKLSKDGEGVKAEEEYFLNGRTFQNHHGGMVLLDGYVYAGARHNEGYPICIELKTGKVVWGGDKRGPGDGSAAVTYADGNLIFRYEDGNVALIEATTKGYQLNGKFMPVHQQGRSWAHPVVTGGRLYLREQDQLMCYDLSSQ